jgi:hypothetical protein
MKWCVASPQARYATPASLALLPQAEELLQWQESEQRDAHQREVAARELADMLRSQLAAAQEQAASAAVLAQRDAQQQVASLRQQLLDAEERERSARDDLEGARQQLSGGLPRKGVQGWQPSADAELGLADLLQLFSTVMPTVCLQWHCAERQNALLDHA